METSADDEENLDATLASIKREITKVNGRGLVAKQVNLLESSTPPLLAMSPLKEQEKKRPMRSKEVGNVTNNPLFGSAPSDEEGDRVQ